MSLGGSRIAAFLWVGVDTCFSRGRRVKYGILDLKPAVRLERRGQNGQNEADQRYNCANLADSVTTRIWFRYTPADVCCQTGEGEPKWRTQPPRLPLKTTRHLAAQISTATPNCEVVAPINCTITIETRDCNLGGSFCS